jgi:hypothetical protein
MAITKKVKSPTGRPSKVNPAVDAFMQGKDTRGKRPVVKPVPPPRKKANVKTHGVGTSTAAKMDRGEIIRKKSPVKKPVRKR